MVRTAAQRTLHPSATSPSPYGRPLSTAGMFSQPSALFSSPIPTAYHGQHYTGFAQSAPSIEQIVDTALQRWSQTQEQRDGQLRQMITEELAARDAVLLKQVQQTSAAEIQHRLSDYVRQDEMALVKEELHRLRSLAADLAQEVRRGRQVPSRPHETKREKQPTHDSDAESMSSVEDAEAHFEPPRLPSLQARSKSKWKGPRHPGLIELEPSDPRFRDVLLYRRYRLLQRNVRMGPEVSRNIGIWTRRLEYVMGKHVFSGTNPVACLKFLSVFKTQLDNEGVPEAGALKVWPSFLSGDALDVFNGMTEDGDGELGCFTTWSEAVQFFLRTYAKDQHLEDAVEKLDRLTQGETEGVMDFYRKLTRAARDLAGVFSQGELMTRFQRGLLPSLRPLLRQVRKDFFGPNAFAEFAEHAAALHTSQQAVVGRTRSHRPVRALAIEEEPRATKRELKAAIREFGDTTVALAEQGSTALPPSRTPTASVEYSESEAASISLSAHTAPPDPEGYAVLMHSDTVDLVTGERRRTPSVQRQHYQYRQGTIPYFPDVCYECFVPGHRKPNCPHLNRSILDVAFRNWVSENFSRLETWIQERLRSLGRAPSNPQVDAHPQPGIMPAAEVITAASHPPPPPAAVTSAEATLPTLAQPRVVQRRPGAKN